MVRSGEGKPGDRGDAILEPITHVIGIDGGGTNCRVGIEPICGGDRIVVNAGSANVSTMFDVAIANIKRALDEARHRSQLDEGAMKNAVGFAGLAGIKNEQMAARVSDALCLGRFHVTEDRVTAVSGALRGSDGAVAAIGTGSFLARVYHGETRYIGGWGFYIGDQASGAWLGRHLLCEVMLAHDGLAPHSDLLRETADHFDDDFERIFTFSVEAKPHEYARFAPRVIEAAEQGDVFSIGILRRGADYIESALAQMGWHAPEPLCLLGGVGPLYSEFFSKVVAESVVEPRGTGLDGAIYLASQRAKDLARESR